ESLADVSGQLLFGPTKTYAARNVVIPRFLVDELARHLQDEVRPDATALVFTGRGNQPLRNSSFHKAVWAPAVRRAGLPVALRIHDLRHTCAALLIDQGAHVKAIQRHLGHSSPVVTLNTYSHLFPEELDRLANRLDETRARGLAAPPRPGPTSNVVKLDEREVQNRAVTRNSFGRRAWDSNP
ncbi:MAG: site-specific integrase, partial [Actinomycetota bacterium]|nr:site-specific integrase [Actinomycetota bacterium]